MEQKKEKGNDCACKYRIKITKFLVKKSNKRGRERETPSSCDAPIVVKKTHTHTNTIYINSTQRNIYPCLASRLHLNFFFVVVVVVAFYVREVLKNFI